MVAFITHRFSHVEMFSGNNSCTALFDWSTRCLCPTTLVLTGNFSSELRLSNMQTWVINKGNHV